MNKRLSTNDLAYNMQVNLQLTKKAQSISKLDEAVEAIHSAIEIFEERGLTTHADACLEVLLKIATLTKNVQHQLPSIEVLLENGLTIEDWKSAMQGNLLGKAKLNQSMRNARYDEHQMKSFLGSQYLSPNKTQFILDESVESQKNLSNIGDMISDSVKGLSPEEFKFTSMAKKDKEKPDQRDLKSLADFDDILNKKLDSISSLNEISADDLDTDFKFLANKDSALSAPELLNLEINDDELEAYEDEFYADDESDFEDD